jgi:hypothetical protein
VCRTGTPIRLEREERETKFGNPEEKGGKSGMVSCFLGLLKAIIAYNNRVTKIRIMQ